jgi:hypothetical protein
LTEEEKKLSGDWMEIGTWSNDMANHDTILVGILLHLFYQYMRYLQLIASKTEERAYRYMSKVKHVV